VVSHDRFQQYRRCRRSLNGESAIDGDGLVIAELDGGARLHDEHVAALDGVAVLQDDGV